MTHSDVPPVRVYKVGGSLFDWPDLFDRLASLLAAERSRPLLVAGGGAAADVVRSWDRTFRLGDDRSHRLAIESLRLTAAFLADGLPRGTVTRTREGAEAAWSAGSVPVLDPAAFLRDEEAAGAVPLPASWEVTSDSIAARVAVLWPADLTLVKSTCPELAGRAFVDPRFGTTARRLRSIHWVDLRTGRRGPLAEDD